MEQAGVGPVRPYNTGLATLGCSLSHSVRILSQTQSRYKYVLKRYETMNIVRPGLESDNARDWNWRKGLVLDVKASAG